MKSKSDKRNILDDSVSSILFFQRLFPSANSILVRGNRPILIDPGFQTDLSETEQLISNAGVPPSQVALIVNTHYHSDHVGGNHGFQTHWHTPIAASAIDARLINDRDRDACAAEWLGQPVEPYRVDQALMPGDVLSTGAVDLEVIAAPGHTLGHIVLFARESGVLIAGDTFHADDVAWLNVFREGAAAIYRMMDTLDRLAALPLKRSYSGHGAPCETPIHTIDAARRRYEKWIHDPQKIGWHACKRIFTYALMLEDGMIRPEIERYLLRANWFYDYARFVFDQSPAEFVQPLLDECTRSGGAEWRGDKLYARAPYVAPPRGYADSAKPPKDWDR